MTLSFAMTLADAQFAENRLEQIREIARVFRVRPTMLFELSRGTWSNTEEMTRQFYNITLKPWLTDRAIKTTQLSFMGEKTQNLSNLPGTSRFLATANHSDLCEALGAVAKDRERGRSS